MSREHPQKPADGVIQLAEIRQRRALAREDIVAPIRERFMEEFGELLDEYIDAIDEATGGDPEKAVEEMLAACSAVLALAAEEHYELPEDQIEFIDTVAEIAAELIADDNAQGELFEDDER